MRLTEDTEGKYTGDQIKHIHVKHEKHCFFLNKSKIMRKISMDEKVSFGDAFLLHKIKNRGGRTHSIMNQGKGSILERSRRNSKNISKEIQREVNGLNSTNGELYSPQDNDTKSLPIDRRQFADNCASMMHTECLATPVKKW